MKQNSTRFESNNLLALVYSSLVQKRNVYLLKDILDENGHIWTNTEQRSRLVLSEGNVCMYVYNEVRMQSLVKGVQQN